jgi:hypothetical protein
MSWWNTKIATTWKIGYMFIDESICMSMEGERYADLSSCAGRSSVRQFELPKAITISSSLRSNRSENCLVLHRKNQLVHEALVCGMPFPPNRYRVRRQSDAKQWVLFENTGGQESDRQIRAGFGK